MATIPTCLTALPAPDVRSDIGPRTGDSVLGLPAVAWFTAVTIQAFAAYEAGYAAGKGD